MSLDEPKVLRATSFSKINLLLAIEGVLPDGRHRLSTWFQAIDYGDDLTAWLHDEVVLDCDIPDLCPMRDNLAWKAADLLRRESGTERGVRLLLEKRVPHGAGLGGGSGDAAAVLRLCNELWGLHWSLERLEELGSRLGADVPFLVAGGAAWAEGAGDRLRIAPGLHPDVHILVATPDVGVNTGWAYRTWDERNPPGLPERPSRTNLPGLHSRTSFLAEDLRGLLFNDFEDLVHDHFPAIARIRAEMGEAGAAASLLSGSGSSVFGLFEGRTAPGAILREWERRNIRWRWCRPAAGAPRE